MTGDDDRKWKNSIWKQNVTSTRVQARMQREGYGGKVKEVKFSGSTFGSCTTVTAQFSSFVHRCGCSQL